MEIILYEIKKLFDSVSETESQNTQLHLQTQVTATLLRHVGTDLINLGLQEYSLERELESKNEKLFALENENPENSRRESSTDDRPGSK